MLQLVKVLIPSWEFFDCLAPAPELYYRRIQESVPQQSEWILCIPKIKVRRFKNIFINAYENYLFASHALVEYLMTDLRDEADPSVSLELVKNLVLRQMQEELQTHLVLKTVLKTDSKKNFQFMVSMTSSEADAFYVSPVLTDDPE